MFWLLNSISGGDVFGHCSAWDNSDHCRENPVSPVVIRALNTFTVTVQDALVYAAMNVTMVNQGAITGHLPRC